LKREKSWRKHERKPLNEREKALAQNKKTRRRPGRVPPDPHHKNVLRDGSADEALMVRPLTAEPIRLEKTCEHRTTPRKDRLSWPRTTKANAPSKSKITGRGILSPRRRIRQLALSRSRGYCRQRHPPAVEGSSPEAIRPTSRKSEMLATAIRPVLEASGP